MLKIILGALIIIADIALILWLNLIGVGFIRYILCIPVAFFAGVLFFIGFDEAR